MKYSIFLLAITAVFSTGSYGDDITNRINQGTVTIKNPSNEGISFLAYDGGEAIKGLRDQKAHMRANLLCESLGYGDSTSNQSDVTTVNMDKLWDFDGQQNGKLYVREDGLVGNTCAGPPCALFNNDSDLAGTNYVLPGYFTSVTCLKKN